MRIKIPVLVVLALLLAGAPAFGDEGRGGLSRFTYNPAGNGYPLVDQSSFQLAQTSSGAGNQKTSSAPAEPSMAEIANKANNPLSDVWLLLMQNDTTLFGGDLVKGTKVLNSTEGAHLKYMSPFEPDEHLRELTPLPSAEVESAGGQPTVKLKHPGDRTIDDLVVEKLDDVTVVATVASGSERHIPTK